MARGRSELDHRFRVGLAVVLVVVGLTFGVVLQGLLSSVTAASQRAERAEDVVRAVLQLDGLEWRAIAGESLDELRPGLETLMTALAAPLDGIDGTAGDSLGRAASDYQRALQRELDALAAGDVTEARQVDEEDVDPAFERLLEDARGVVDESRDDARRTGRSVATLAWAMVGLAVSIVGASGWFIARHRDRRLVAIERDAADRRLRALVEGSSDVIVVVDSDDQVSVLTPSLGFLSPSTGSAATPRTMHEILASGPLAKWLEFDDLVRRGQPVEGVQLELTGRGGCPVTAEVSGRGLPDEPGVRVWTWRDISERKTFEDRLNHQAFHDGLTGLANRTLLHDRAAHAIERAERTAEPVSMLLCDLDDFKTINDVLGHLHGDEVLRVVANRMAGCLRGSDTLSRLGGDEFAVLMEGSDLETAREVAERIIAAVGQHLELVERDIYPSMTIGIAQYERGISSNELLRRADVAMYEAKRSGKGRAATYRPDAATPDTDQLVMLSELRRAVREGGLHLAYQPTVSLLDGSIPSVEALVRWNHPSLGPIPPARFIPMAEESGCIIALGQWVLSEACRAIEPLIGENGLGLAVHVNVSPHQLNDPGFVSYVKHTLSTTGMEPSRLVLELTEGSLLGNAGSFDQLIELRGHGVRLAIDDFGTGYASITYLQRLPIDILKIDRAFVSGDALPDSERRAFLNTIINMAHNLQLTAVAEGVETEAQAAEVAELGCDRGQGYLWCRPVDIDALRHAIDRHHD